MFDDTTLAPLVLANKLPVSRAEELLLVKDAGQRGVMAQQAVDGHREWPQLRAAARECSAALQQLSPRLASRIRALAAVRD